MVAGLHVGGARSAVGGWVVEVGAEIVFSNI